jgi:hypothetical protein
MFDGQTYHADLDQARLTTEFERVKALMADGQWRTLKEIRIGIGGGSEPGISARLRDLRKAKYGAYIVERRRRGNPKAGLWEYRVGRYVQVEMPL